MPSDQAVNILLVDDHPGNLVALESVLGDLRQNLVPARSGKEAIKRLLDEEFAVILLDVQMPEMDGFETAALIRSRERTRHTPIIFLTAIDMSETHVARGYSLGAVDYLFKPLDPEVLRAKVLAFVELAHKHRQLQEEIVRRHEAEKALTELNDSLEHRIRQRTAELETVNRELEQANRAKDEFLAMLAHELRNPLASIKSAAQLLKLAAPTPVAEGGGQREEGSRPSALRPPPSALTRAHEIIERQINHQAHLLDDLLDVSRITRGKITLRRQPLDLVRLVREAADDSRGAIEAAGLTLELSVLEEPLWVDGDATRLAQVVGNLLNNAIKFSEPGGEVQVQVFRASGVQAFRCSGIQDIDPERLNARTPERLNADAADAAVLTVRDRGIGIEPDMLSRVFETFTQADGSLDRSQGGLGLGLALVKGLAELHGGSVRVQSEGLGHGSTFTVCLPLTTLQATGDRRQATVKTSGGHPPELSPVAITRSAGTRLSPGERRVLVIEDNTDAAESLRDLLELQGCTVAVVHSGSEGLDEARRAPPDVVICDIGLPGMDGYEVAAALRLDPATAAARLIALTGYGREEDRLRSQEAGFDAHLTKPVDITELQRLLAATA